MSMFPTQIEWWMNYRVLKKEGSVIFQQGTNIWLLKALRSSFLSWRFKRVAHLYLRITGKGHFYYEEHRSLGLKRLVRKFRVHDYTIALFVNLKDFLRQTSSIKIFFLQMDSMFAPFLYPGFRLYLDIDEKQWGHSIAELQDHLGWPSLKSDWLEWYTYSTTSKTREKKTYAKRNKNEKSDQKKKIPQKRMETATFFRHLIAIGWLLAWRC